MIQIISTIDLIKNESKYQDSLEMNDLKWFKYFQYLIQLWEWIIKIYQYKPFFIKISTLKIPKNQFDLIFFLPKVMDILKSKNQELPIIKNVKFSIPNWIQPLFIIFLQNKFQKNEDYNLLKILQECYIESLRDPLYLKFNSKI
eukprot:gene6467-10473_t